MRREIKATEIISDRYVMSEKDVCRSIRESVPGRHLFEMEVRGNLDKVTVICDPNFMHELFGYYHWRERNAQNYLEDTFRISGQIFHSEDKVIIVPRFLLRMVSTNRKKTEVKTNVVNKAGAEYQNYVLNCSLDATDYRWLKSFGPLYVLGHGHSHPDLGIGVTPSTTDVTEHRENLADHTFWLSQIVDPIRGMSGFYFGYHLNRPKVIYMLYPEDHDLFQQEKKMFNRSVPVIVPKHEHKVTRCDEDVLKPQEADVRKECVKPETENGRKNYAFCFQRPETEPAAEENIRNSQAKTDQRKKKSQKRMKKLIRKTAMAYVRSNEFIDRIMALISEQLNR